MNRIYWISILIILIPVLFSCIGNSAKEKDGISEVTMSFKETVYDFGTIPFDSDGRCYFEFINNSDQPLLVNTVRTSCGCTRPEWPEEPVNPGNKGRIGITYNTKITGAFHKSITVYSNANNSPVKLFIKGNVEAGKEEKS
jgi:hypothetical protein